MSKFKAEDYSTLGIEERVLKLEELKKSIVMIRFQSLMKSGIGDCNIRFLRKEVARLNTLIRQSQLGGLICESRR